MTEQERRIRADAFPAGLAQVLMNDPTARNVYEKALAVGLGVVETLTWMVCELAKDKQRIVEEAVKRMSFVVPTYPEPPAPGQEVKP